MVSTKKMPMDLIEFKYVTCPRIKSHIRLKYAYKRYQDKTESRRMLIDCVGSLKCGLKTINKGKVIFDSANCPFGKIDFLF